jgi:hypothetical protein
MDCETIYLSLIKETWHADFSETSERAHIIDLFGCTLIPTPFTMAADTQQVLNTVAARNSKYNVAVR